MRYKGDFKPSQVLDTASNEWVALDGAVSKALDEGVRYGFASESGRDKAAATSKKVQSRVAASHKAKTAELADAETEDEEDDDSPPFPEPSPPGFAELEEVDGHTLASALVLDAKAQSRGVQRLIVSCS